MRDPLWMLTRQWQFGEFRGEDAASPVTARIAYRHHRTGLVSLRDARRVPLRPGDDAARDARRARADPAHVCATQASGEVFSDVLFAVRWGKRLLQMMKDAGLDGHYGLYLEQVPDSRPAAAPAHARTPRRRRSGVIAGSWRAASPMALRSGAP